MKGYIYKHNHSTQGFYFTSLTVILWYDRHLIATDVSKQFLYITNNAKSVFSPSYRCILLSHYGDCLQKMDIVNPSVPPNKYT